MAGAQGGVRLPGLAGGAVTVPPLGVHPALLIAPAKLTLELRITGVRGDGMHEIDAEMVSLDLYDSIELQEYDSTDGNDNRGGIRYSGPAAPPEGVGPGDLIARALHLTGVRADAEVWKRIPAGAGLGGGSADAAAVLRWRRVDDLELAATLGADVPFCLRGGRARVTGIGERVQALPFSAEDFTLVTPPIHASTPVVYRAWDDLGGPRHESGNDLVPAALRAYPELTRWRDELRDASGQEPRLAGSGSTWFVSGHDSTLGVSVSTVPIGWLPVNGSDHRGGQTPGGR